MSHSDDEEHLREEEEEEEDAHEQNDEEEDFHEGRDEDDEEDEEEEESQRPKKKSRMHNFILDEAEVDDDEDEEEYDDLEREDGFIQEEAEELDEAEANRLAAKHQELDRRRGEMEDLDAEAIAARFQDKYGARRTHRAPRETDHIPQSALAPSVHDPNLWAIKVKPGKERDIVLQLMRKSEAMAFSDNPLEILSAFTRDHLKGYVYVEARKLAHVQHALNGMLGVYMSSISLVSIQDMVNVLKIVKKEVDLEPGRWVRIRRGLYQGDLAQIIEIPESGDSVVVKLIPRLDLGPKEELIPGSKRKKNTSNFGMRPPQKLFNPKEIDKLERSKSLVIRRHNVVTYGNEVFRDGYLEKDVKISNLILDEVNPTLDEVTKFQGGGGEENEGIDVAALTPSVTSNIVGQFVPGDHVEVIKGEMMHMHGIVDSVKDGSVFVRPQIVGQHKLWSIKPHLLRKRFSEGDHVRVINGQYKDETGLIVKIDENVVTMLSDLTMSEISVFSKDLREAADVSSGANRIANYELHDFVQIDQHTSGVIIRVERDTLRVMDQFSHVHTVQPHQIITKKDTKFAVAADSAGISIGVGDTVKELDGDERKGVILHIFRGYAFLHSRELLDNYGVFVVHTSNLLNQTPKAARSEQLDTMNPAIASNPFANTFARPGGNDFRGGRGRGRGGRGGVGLGRGRGRRDPLISQTVRIATGPYKGYVGIVKDTSETHARIELHTNSKVVSVPKPELLTENGEPFGPRNNFAPRYPEPAASKDRWGSTPAAGSQTPAWGGAGSRTPAWSSSRTPAWSGAGSQTPAWNAAGSRTPMHGGSTPNPYRLDGSQTPVWDVGNRTPYHASGDDSWNSNDRSGRDGWGGDKSSSSRRDGWDNERSSSKRDDWSSSSRSRTGHTEEGRGASNRTSSANDSFGSSARDKWKQSSTRSNDSRGNGDVSSGGGGGQTGGVPTSNSANWDTYTAAPTPGNTAPYSSHFPPTPGPNSAPTPYFAAPTPSASGYGHHLGPVGAPTPAPSGGPSMFVAKTPGNISAPTPVGHVAPTPFMPSGGDYSAAGDGSVHENVDEGDWATTDIEVKVVRRGGNAFQDGAYDGQTGAVLEVPTASTCRVKLQDGHELIIPTEFLDPVRPTKRDKAKCILGDHQGELGMLAGLDANDAIVKLKNFADFKIISIRHLARYTGTESCS
ncbi:uncharacterized protein VTP21DRAFT_11402 [Calcarisporiella thermophila]|uniref:uncharacterized protein n=1 Tax=Calcarisporiella thermophila TaxID=911321 RepID=UPI003742BE11